MILWLGASKVKLGFTGVYMQLRCSTLTELQRSNVNINGYSGLKSEASYALLHILLYVVAHKDISFFFSPFHVLSWRLTRMGRWP